MVKIVIHTQYYPPEIGAPQARLSELADGLTEKGYQVTVLTGMPSYPLGKIYPGYKGTLRIQQVNGVEIIRTAIFPTQKSSLLPRLANYFSFVLSSWLIGGWYIGKPDFILTESPPLFLGISGYLLSRWKKAKWIFNVSDLWPESALRLGLIKSGLVLDLTTKLEAFCYHKAWAVSGQSKSILEDIQARFPDKKTCLLSNGVDIIQFHPSKATKEAREFLGLPDDIIVLYAGLHGLAQGLEQVLKAAKKLQDRPRIKFVLVGDGPCKQELMENARSLQLNNLVFKEPVPKSSMPAIIASADICIVPLVTDLPGAVPSKIYEAMAAGRPIVLAATGEAAEIVDRYKAGLVVRPGDIESLASIIRMLTDNPDRRQELGEAGRLAVETCFNRKEIIDHFSQFLGSGS